LSAQPSLCSTDLSAAERWRLDLAGLAQVRLEKMGVTEIEQSASCTYTNPKYFFSYRRDRQTGRMATVAWLSSER